ncbi:MAG: diaminopimelate epimerase [Tissierellia bacterium]|nr:diaminopimelate epimerase [Tissierellia bacterium]
MKLHFVKVNPVENMTIFVLDQIPRENQIDISNKLMDYSSLHAEQVGFIEASKNDNSLIRLQMMGGEFCGNATRSLAAFMVHSQYPQVSKVGDKYMVALEVSGIDEIINCEVENLEKDNLYLSKIKMPLPISVKEMDIHFENTPIHIIRVDLPGITHFIVDKDKVSDKNEFYRIIKKKLSNEKYDAFGIMYYDFNKNFMEPLVYVKATDSLFWERSCASGTCALGCALSYTGKRSIDKDVFQPGGHLKVSVAYENEKITSLYLNGEVEIVSEGIVYV